MTNGRRAIRAYAGSARRLGLCAALALGAVAVPLHQAHADDAPGTLPITVIGIQTANADDQAEALTAALRNAVRAQAGWSSGQGEYSLEVLALGLKCVQPPDPTCESRIADQIKADRFIWGVITKKAGTVRGEVHFWQRGKGSTKVDVDYSANLTEPTDDALKKVAADAVVALTGGAAKGTVKIAAGKVPGQVFADGEPIGALEAGTGVFSLPVGTHKIVVRAQGYADMEASVTVKPNDSASVSLTPVVQEAKAPTNWRRIGGFVGLGAGVAFGAVGLLGALSTNSANNDLDEERGPAKRKYRDDYLGLDACDEAEAGKGPNAVVVDEICSSGRTGQLLQIIFFPLAAVSGGVGTYLLLTSYDEDEVPSDDKAGFTVHPHIGIDSGKIDLTYRF
ncbi:MAG: PEGA domain-containing protein [Polyangiaceae bacterium]